MIDGRVPPQAVEVEDAILGSIMIDSGAATEAFQELREVFFYKPENISVFHALRRLYTENKSLDMLSVEEELRNEGQLDHVGGASYLSDLTRSVSSSANIGYHIQIIREKWIKRESILKATEVIRQAYDTSSDAYDVLDLFQESAFGIVAHEEGRTHEIHETINSVLEELTERVKSDTPLGLMTGFSIDYMLHGFQNGRFYVLAARPSMGKTAFALEIMRRVAKGSFNAGIVSLETSHMNLGYRLLAQSSGIPGDQILSGNLNKNEFEKVIQAATELSTYGIVIDDTLTMTETQFRAKARHMKHKYKVDILFVDYVQLLQSESNNREQEVAKISRMCKVVSKELDIPVIGIAQLSRAVETRGGDRRPQLSDLRESGQIEQDADAVLFLYRPEYYGISEDHHGNSTSGTCEVIIAKNKDGGTGTKILEFDKQRMRFSNIDPLMSGRTL